MGTATTRGAKFQLTSSDFYWPDEDGAERRGCDDGHASCHDDHDIVVVPHAGRAALHSTEEMDR